MTELKNAKLLQQAPQRCLSSTFWLVVRHENRQMKALMVSCSGEQALPVFSGEAEMFVWLGGSFENYLQVRDTSAEAHLKSPKGGFRPDVEGAESLRCKVVYLEFPLYYPAPPQEKGVITRDDGPRENGEGT